MTSWTYCVLKEKERGREKERVRERARENEDRLWKIFKHFGTFTYISKIKKIHRVINTITIKSSPKDPETAPEDYKHFLLRSIIVYFSMDEHCTLCVDESQFIHFSRYSCSHSLKLWSFCEMDGGWMDGNRWKWIKW